MRLRVDGERLANLLADEELQPDGRGAFRSTSTRTATAGIRVGVPTRR